MSFSWADSFYLLRLFDYVSPHPFAALPRLTAGEGLGWASPRFPAAVYCCSELHMSQFSGWWTSDVNGQSYPLGGIFISCVLQLRHGKMHLTILAAIPASKSRGAQRVWHWVMGLGSCSSAGSMGYFPRQVAWVPGPAWHRAGVTGAAPANPAMLSTSGDSTWGYKQLCVYAQHLFKSTC